MMSSALLGGASAPSTSAGANAARARDKAPADAERSFERMLQPKEGTAPSAAARKADKQDSAQAKPRADATPDQAAATDPATSTEATDETAATPEATAPTEQDARPNPAAEADDALEWPPAGLAGLQLSLPAQVTDNAQVAVAALPTSTATGTLPAPLTAPGAAPGAAIAGATAGITLDAAPASTEALPEEIASLISSLAGEDAAAADDTGTAPPSLFASTALQALRQGAESTISRSADPTPTPVFGQDGFEDAVSARVGWLADQKIGHAHIRISPDDLGAIDVRLQLDGDKVHASFSSPHVDVRHALESSLPRLRELLGEQGFQLAHADVGQQSSGDPGNAPHGHGTAPGSTDADPTMTEVSLSTAQLIRQRGLLDAYA